MNLSPIARGINALCHQLGARQAKPQEPVLYHTEPLPPPTYRFDGVRFIENAGKPHLIGVDWGSPRGDLTGWWAKIGGNSPTFWPLTIRQADLEEVFGHAQTMSEGAVRTWFDEQEGRFRSERVDLYRADGSPPTRPDLSDAKYAVTTASTSLGPEFTLGDVLRAAEVLKDLSPPPPLRLSRADYIRFTAQMDCYRAAGRMAGRNTLSGLSVEIVPDDDPRRWIPPPPVPLNPGN